MSHFARIENNIVKEVIVAEQDFINTITGEYIQTSYNTIGGKHTLGGIPLRKNYAGIGYTYDRERDAFIPPKPYDSWLLDEDSCLWYPPAPCPTDAPYNWNEEEQRWQSML